MHIIRCDPGKGQRRCGTGYVMLRMTYKGAVEQARRHASRTGHRTSVHRVYDLPDFFTTKERVEAEGYIAPRNQRQEEWFG